MHFLLIGTFHHVHVRQDNSVQTEMDGFEAIVRNAIRDHHPDVIVEEMSEEAMRFRNGTSTIPGELAIKFGLPHAMVDPSHAQRLKAGIETPRDIEISAFIRGIPDDVVAARLAEANRRRERYWLDRILEIKAQRLLFVCGAAHVESFDALAREEGHSVEVLCREWPTGVY